MDTNDPKETPPCCFKTCNNTEETKATYAIKSFHLKEPTTDTSKNVFGIFDEMLFHY